MLITYTAVSDFCLLSKPAGKQQKIIFMYLIISAKYRWRVGAEFSLPR